MGLGRRKVGLEDSSAWVFNRMAHVYDARPPYPQELVASIASLAPLAARVGDFGAGTGHLALPLAELGFDVVAIEPAQAMLERLRTRASARGLSLQTLHAAAESTPLESATLELAIIADALHFLDAERTGLELLRVLRPDGALAVLLTRLADTPYMRALEQLMQEAAPRRPREVAPALAQLAAVAKVTLTHERSFVDHTPVDAETLESILRSISFIGPAMNRERFAAFSQRVHALSERPVWSRRFVLISGCRHGS